MPPTSTRTTAVRSVIAVMALAIVPYLNSLTGEFTFDDLDIIRDNPEVQTEPAVRLLGSVHYPGALYRPLTMLTYAANARLGNQPLGYHVVNVATHALVTAGTFGLGMLILRSHLAALIAAVLFAVHPSHTEAVTSIVGRAELLAALFVVASLLALSRQLRSADGSRLGWSALSLMALALGLLAKESAFTAIAMVPVLHAQLVPHDTLRRRVRVLAPFVLLGISYLALRIIVVGSLALPDPPASLDNPLAHVSPFVRMGTALVVLWDYAALLIVPLQLTADYSFNQVPLVLSATDPRLLTAVFALCAVGTSLTWYIARIRGLAAALCFTILPIALTANVLFPIGTIKAERLLYLPSLGACLIAAALLTQTQALSKRYAQVLLVLVVSGFALQTWSRNRDWQSNLTLFQATVANSPNSAKAHYNLGVFLQDAGRANEAVDHYRRALEIYPEYAAAYYAVGHVYELRGNLPAAVSWYTAALERDWALAKAHRQLGSIYRTIGAYTAAEAALGTALQEDPSDPLLLINLSAVALSQGDRWRAQALIDQLDTLSISNEETLEIVAAARHEITAAIQ